MLFLLAGTASLLSSTQAFGQQSCRATPISGTRTNNAFTVWKDSVMLSPMHSSYSGAESHFAAELEADSTAALAIMQYMRGVWRRPNGRDCGPETDLPPWPPVGGECPSCPPPDTVIVELPPPPPDTVFVELPPPPPDTVIVEVPSPPDTVLVTDTVFVDLPCNCDTVPLPPDSTPEPPPPPPPDSGAIAEMPRVVIRWSEPVPTNTVNVAASDDLQAAINAAQVGDLIEVETGATFVGPIKLTSLQGGFATLRGASCPVAFGSRIRQQDLAALPYIETPDNRSALDGRDASGWWITCVGFRPTASSTTKVNDLVQLVGADSVVLDRVHIAGRPTQSVKRGVAANGSNLMITGSRIEEIHVSGQTSQTVAVWNSPGGVIRIHNNFLAASGVNLLLGGAKAWSAASLPRDIEITRNHIYKDPAWQGQGLNVKNLFEIKTGHRVLFEGNVAENVWAEAQGGYWTVIKSGEQTILAGNTEDVTIRLNRIISVFNGPNFVRWSSNGQVTTLPTSRILYEQNFYDDFGQNHGSTTGSGGIPIQFLAPEDVVIRNNTTMSPSGNATGYAKGSGQNVSGEMNLEGNLWTLKGLSNWPWALAGTWAGNLWINTRNTVSFPAGTTIFPGDAIPPGYGADEAAVNAATSGVQDPNP